MIPQQETTEFSQLVLGFSSAALYYLGSIELEGKNIDNTNYSLAKHNIDILDMLLVKTKGNLTVEEDKLLRQVLQDLKVKFIERSENKTRS